MGLWRQEVLDGSRPLTLLEERAPERRRELGRRLGEETLRQVEQRLTLVTLDRCWSQHLAELQRQAQVVALSVEKMPAAVAE